MDKASSGRIEMSILKLLISYLISPKTFADKFYNNVVMWSVEQGACTYLSDYKW